MPQFRRAVYALACEANVRLDRCGCARPKSSSPSQRSPENDWPVPPTFPRLDRKPRATYGADHPQGVYPYLCSSQTLAKHSLHYLLKCSSRSQIPPLFPRFPRKRRGNMSIAREPDQSSHPVWRCEGRRWIVLQAVLHPTQGCPPSMGNFFGGTYQGVARQTATQKSGSPWRVCRISSILWWS